MSLTSYVLTALSPVPLFVFGYATHRRSLKPISKVLDYEEFKYQVSWNEFERKSSIVVMVIAIVIWLCLILLRALT